MEEAAALAELKVVEKEAAVVEEALKVPLVLHHRGLQRLQRLQNLQHPEAVRLVVAEEAAGLQALAEEEAAQVAEEEAAQVAEAAEEGVLEVWSKVMGTHVMGVGRLKVRQRTTARPSQPRPRNIRSIHIRSICRLHR
jgi:hypothetical protein